MKKKSHQPTSFEAFTAFNGVDVPDHLAETVKDLARGLLSDPDPKNRRALMALASVSAAVIAVDVNTRLEAVERRLAAIEATLNTPEKSPE